jgi:hypothetical protein
VTYKSEGLKYTDVMKPDDINVAHLWVLFAGAVLPADAPALQRTEMQKAFYAGFFESFKIFVDISSTLSEPQAVKVLDRLNKESKEFFEKMMKEHNIR